MTDQELESLGYDWPFWARPAQIAPDWDWFVWLVLAGRGFGKTRTCAEWVISQVKSGFDRIALIARTAADVRDVMIEGESGIIERCHPDFRPKYIVSKRELRWPSGQIAKCYSAEEPDQLRGPQHSKGWAEELAAWPTFEAWDNLIMGLRLGKHPQVVVSTTPRPIRILRQLLEDKTTAVTRGSTLENAINLPKQTIAELRRRYEGTRLGRQELEGEILSDIEGALWSFDQLRSLQVAQVPVLERVVVGVDPAIATNRNCDATGIVTVGLGVDGLVYVLQDDTTKASPAQWAARLKSAVEKWTASCVVLETNRGGDTVEYVVRSVFGSVDLTIKTFNSQESKASRAEPVSAMYEKGMVRHLGDLKELVDEMTSWVPGFRSPNRIDALVFGVTELVPHDALPAPAGAIARRKKEKKVGPSWD